MRPATLSFYLLACAVSSAVAAPVPDDCGTTLTLDNVRELLEARWSEIQPSSPSPTPDDDTFDALEDLEVTLTVSERVRKVLDSESPVESSFLLRIPELKGNKIQQHDKELSGSLPSMPTAALESLRQAETEQERIRLCTIRSQKHAAEAAEPGYGKRDHSDILVVGLVVLFIVAAVMVELLEKAWVSIRTRFIGGRIRLEETNEKGPLTMEGHPPTWRRSYTETAR